MLIPTSIPFNIAGIQSMKKEVAGIETGGEDKANEPEGLIC